MNKKYMEPAAPFFKKLPENPEIMKRYKKEKAKTDKAMAVYYARKKAKLAKDDTKGYIKNPPKKDDPLAGDLSGYLSTLKWRKTRFVFAPNDATVTIRVPRELVDVAKKVAKKRGIKYHRMMRDAIVNDVLKVA